MNLAIRHAEIRDANKIVELTRVLASFHGDSTNVTEDYVLEYLASGQTGVIIAEIEGEVAGLVSYLIKPDLYEGAPVSIIEELVVTGPHRGKGIGHKLLMTALNELTFKGIKTAVITVDKDNKIAQDMYYKTGFQDIGDLLLYKDL